MAAGRMDNPWDLVPTFGGDPFEWFKSGMIGEHGGGGYSALFSQAQEEGQPFAGMDPSKMTVDEVLEFNDPGGPYAQWVAKTRRDEGNMGNPAGPVGNYQFIHTTLKGLKDKLGLRGDEPFNEELQDKLARTLAYDTGLGEYAGGLIDKATFERRTKGVWPGWRDPTEVAADAVTQEAMAVPAEMKKPGGPMAVNPLTGAPIPPGMWSDPDRDPPGNLIGRLLGGSADQRDKLKFAHTASAIGEGLSAIGQRRPVDLSAADQYRQRANVNRTAEYLRRNGREDIAKMIETGQMSAGQAMQIIASQQKGPTAAQQNFEYAQKHPEFAQHLKDTKGGVNIDQRQESSYSTERGKGLAKNRSGVEAAGMAAGPNIGEWRLLQSVLKGADTGTTAPVTLAMKRAASFLGLDFSKDIGAADAIDSIANKMALRLRSPEGGAGMPGAMSDKDREFLVRMVPGIEKTDFGNDIIVEAGLRMEQRNKDIWLWTLEQEELYDSTGGKQGTQFGTSAYYRQLDKQFGGDSMYDDLIERTEKYLADPEGYNAAMQHINAVE